MEKPIKTSSTFNRSQEKSHSLPKIEQTKGQFKISHYLIGEMIGKGGFGVVHKAIQLYTKLVVAVKIINVSALSFKYQEHLKSQISILRSMDHPNIIKLYEILHDQDRIFIFMELIKGFQLYQLIRTKGKLSERPALKIFKQVCLAVQYLHRNRISHRDIKTENIMVDWDYNIKLIDFGLAKKERAHPFFSTFCGSPSYTAPEMFQKAYYVGKKIDVWCLGVILFAMVEGCYPFGRKDLENLERNENEDRSYFKSYQKRIKFSSQELIQVYNKIFNHENQRVSIQDLLSIPLIERSGSQISVCENISQLEKRKQKIIKKISEVLFLDEAQVQRTLAQEEDGKITSLYKILTFQWIETKEIVTHERKTRTTRRTGESQECSLDLKQKAFPIYEKRDSNESPKKKIRDRRSMKSCKIKAFGMQSMIGEHIKLKIKTDEQRDEKTKIVSKGLGKGKGNSINISQQLSSYLEKYKKKSIFRKMEDRTG